MKANNEMKISIIIASKNRISYLGVLLDDLSTQTLLPEEIIIVDQSHAPYHLSQDVRIIHIRDLEQGPCHARNLGLKNCRGDIIVFLDDDVRIESDFIYTLTRPIIEEGYPVVVGAVCNSLGEYPNQTAQGRFEKGRNWLLTLTTNPDYPGRCTTLSFPAGCAAIKREVFMAVGGFDTFFDPNGAGEDRDYAIRLLKAGYPILYEGRAIIRHLGAGTGGRRDSRAAFNRLNILDANSAYIVRKHFSQEVFDQFCRSWFDSFAPKNKLHVLGWAIALEKRREATKFINSLRKQKFSNAEGQD